MRNAILKGRKLFTEASGDRSPRRGSPAGMIDAPDARGLQGSPENSSNLTSRRHAVLQPVVARGSAEARTGTSRIRSSGRGFTLIELLIVIAIIGIMAGIAIPLFKSSVRKANETAAVGTLNAIRVAQAKYVIDHKGQYGTFRELFEEGYLDKRFNYDQPHERGYVFVITLIPKSEGKAATFKVNANPEQSDGIGATGKNFYYVDPESGICFSKAGPATAADHTI